MTCSAANLASAFGFVSDDIQVTFGIRPRYAASQSQTIAWALAFASLEKYRCVYSWPTAWPNAPFVAAMASASRSDFAAPGDRTVLSNAKCSAATSFGRI